MLSLEAADGMIKNNTPTPKKAIQLILHGIRFVSEHLEPLENRATTSAGKPVSILRDITKKCHPFWTVAGLFSVCFIKLRLLHDFCTDSP